MPIYAIEVAVVCDDLMEDGIPALTLITEALGIELSNDSIALEYGTDDSGHPVLLATLSVPDNAEETLDVS
jgi:hypothetical protein